MKKEKESGKNELSITWKFLMISLCLTVLCILLGSLSMHFAPSYEDAFSDGGEEPVRVVIDAGHGGEDGGAVGIDGTLEKTVNLDVARLVCDMLSASGIKCVMTRTEDIMLYDMYDDLSDYKGHKKMYDLKNRLKFAEEHEDAVFVSIHMNSFVESKYSGLQVYYSPNDKRSVLLAESVRASVSAYLQPENERETKRAGSSIYILNRITIPSILVECGFLSNPEECALLGKTEYKQKLALAISSAVAEYVAGAVGET